MFFLTCTGLRRNKEVCPDHSRCPILSCNQSEEEKLTLGLPVMMKGSLSESKSCRAQTNLLSDASPQACLEVVAGIINAWARG